MTDDKPNASSSKKRKAADTDIASVDLSDTTDGTSSDESNELSDLHGTPAYTLRSRVASHSPEQNKERTPSARAPLPAPGLQSAQQLRQPAATSADAAAVSEELQAPAVVHSILHARVKPEPYSGHTNQAVHISQLQLDTCVDISAPATQWQLQTGVQPDSQLSATWRSSHREPQLYSLQLIPDAQHPRIRVGVEPAMLRTYSLWARTCSPIDVVLSPLRVSQNTLYIILHSLYSGFIDMSCDVEELLMLARHLQVSILCSVQPLHVKLLQLPKVCTLHVAAVKTLAVIYQMLCTSTSMEYDGPTCTATHCLAPASARSNTSDLGVPEASQLVTEVVPAAATPLSALFVGSTTKAPLRKHICVCRSVLWNRCVSDTCCLWIWSRNSCCAWHHSSIL